MQAEDTQSIGVKRVRHAGERHANLHPVGSVVLTKTTLEGE